MRLQQATNPELANRLPEKAELTLNPNAPPTLDLQPAKNMFLRCPVPPTNAGPDTLRQFYSGGDIPQRRTFTPPQQQSGGGGGTTNVSVAGGTSVSTAITQNVTNQITNQILASTTARNAAIKTPSLNPNQNYQISVQMAKTITLIRVTVSAAARVRLYSTKAAQTTDLSRDR